MKPIVLAILGVAAILFLFSCKDKKNEDITQTINKSGSIETAIQVSHLDSTRDILITTHKVWANYNEIKTLTYVDTVPALGMITKEAENEDGDKKMISVKKEYEIFITVK